MAQIFDPPESIKVPEFNWQDIDQYNKDCDRFKSELKTFCIERAEKSGVTDENFGEIIRFPVADGYAEYMVAALKPVQLIHIPLWDAWHFQYAKNLTKKDIVDKVKQQKSLEKLFADKKK
jgi:hypothetical protein